MNGWIHRDERLPTRADGNENGYVWVDDGLQVTICYWARVETRTDIEFWQPCPPRHKPGRARRMA